MENTQRMLAVILCISYFTLAATSAVKPPGGKPYCDRTQEDQNLPHESDCSKYYRCVYGKRVPKECPERMLFNPSIGNCDLYYNVECTSNDDGLQQTQNLAEAIESLTGRSFVKTPKQVSTPLKSRKSNTESNYIISTKVGETSTIRFVYLPHDSDPRAYYKIENGDKILLYCEKGKVFSFELEICAIPFDAN